MSSVETLTFQQFPMLTCSHNASHHLDIWRLTFFLMHYVGGFHQKFSVYGHICIIGFTVFSPLSFWGCTQIISSSLLIIIKGAMCKMFGLIPRSSNTKALGFLGRQILALWLSRSGRPPTQNVSIWWPENETQQSTILKIAPLKANFM